MYNLRVPGEQQLNEELGEVKRGKGHFDWSHGPKVSLFAISSRHDATAESFTAAPVL